MTMPRLTLLLSLLLLLGLPAGALRAQQATHPWKSLTPAQQELLSPLRDKWDGMPPHRQNHLLEKTTRWVNLPPRKREEIRERIARWQRMTPAQRAEARHDLNRFHRLPPDRQTQLRAAFERFQNLPPDQRERLLQQWHSKTPAERRQWVHETGAEGAVPPPSMRPFGGSGHH
jgi:hypothetical protein